MTFCGNEQISMMDQLEEGLPETRRRELKNRFCKSSYYEWNFWDQAWRKESWSINIDKEVGV